MILFADTGAWLALYDKRDKHHVQAKLAFQSLVNHLSHLFSALAEGVINKELFPKVFPKFKEAERIISQK